MTNLHMKVIHVSVFLLLGSRLLLLYFLPSPHLLPDDCHNSLAQVFVAGLLPPNTAGHHCHPLLASVVLPIPAATCCCHPLHCCHCHCPSLLPSVAFACPCYSPSLLLPSLPLPLLLPWQSLLPLPIVAISAVIAHLRFPCSLLPAATNSMDIAFAIAATVS